MDKCSSNNNSNSKKPAVAKNRNIVRDLFKESSLSSDDTEFMELPALPKTVEDLAANRRSIVDVENLDVHPCVAAFLMSRMEYYIGRESMYSLILLYLSHYYITCAIANWIHSEMMMMNINISIT